MNGPEDDPAGSSDEPRYSDARTVGRGSMGEVKVVHDGLLGRDVAVKTLRHGRDGVVRRFLRERRITAQLEHPSIVPVHDAGIHDDGRPYYTMKFVRGTELKGALLEADGLAGRLALVPVFASVCQAVAYAHSRGIIHRDLKPSNVMLGPFGEAVVVDWGLARSLEDADDDDDALDLGDTNDTHVGRITGTPGYMAPEQARGEPVDRRSDVYALGAVLYHLLAGVPPHGQGPMEQVLDRAARADVPSLHDRVPRAPRELVAIAERALAPVPSDRYPDAGALAADVNQWLAGLPVAAYRYSGWERFHRYTRRNWRWLLPTGLGVLGIAAASAIGFVNVRQQRDLARANEEHALVARDTAEQALASALAERARLAARIEDGLSAQVLAAEALTHAASPEARGVLAGLWSSPTPRLLDVLTPPHPCHGLAFHGDDLLCTTHGQTTRLRRDGSVVWSTGAGGSQVERVGAEVVTGGSTAHRIDGASGALLETVDALRLVQAGGHSYAMERHDVRVEGTPLLHSAGTLSQLRRLDDELWLLAASGKLWRLDEQAQFELTEVLPIVALDLNADARWFAASGTDVLARPREGGLWTTVPVESEVLQVGVGDEVLLGAAVDQAVYVWELGTWQRIGRLPDHGAPYASVATGPGGIWATGGGRAEVRIWERGRSRPQHLPDMASHSVRTDPRGFNWVCSNDGRLFRTGPERELLPIEHPLQGKCFDCIVADGHLHALFWGGRVVRADADGRSEVLSLDPEAAYLATLDDQILFGSAEHGGLVREDGRTIGSGRVVGRTDSMFLAVDGSELVGFDVEGREHLRRPHGGWHPIGHLDGRLVSVGADGDARLEDLEDGADPLRLVGHTAPVTVAVNAEVDGHPRVVTAGWDHRLLVWDPTTGDLIARLDGHDARVLGLTWDGRFVWSTSFDGSVRLWDLSVIEREPDDLVRDLRERTGLAVRDGHVSFVGNGR